jgi:hypothetical protein
MGPSEKSFQQVRNILGKLDRNIDSLRAQRTTPAAPPPPRQPSAPISPDRTIGTAERSVPGAQAGNQPAPNRAASIYGRAKPLPPA